jgi:hypothetical protein
MRTKKAVVAAAALAVSGWLVSSAVAAADPTPAPPAQPKTTIDADGTYAVGKDIAPGTYSSAGPVGDGTCYWKRTSGSDIVDNALSKKPQIVQIDPTDTAFKTSGCQPWQPADPEAAAPAPVPPLLAQLQLGAALAGINANARQFDGSQIPPP